MANGPGFAPSAETIEQSLSFPFRKHLRIANPIDTTMLGNHGCSDGERTGPRAAPDFIDSNDHAITAVPQATFDVECGRPGSS